MDLIFALLSLLILSPIFIIIAIMIKIDSKGPVFFRQERLGKDGKVFRIYKFRTMIDGAINMGAKLHTYEGDYRITKIGNILRRLSIDELPQIINILKGEMSFIGPRPPVPYYPRQYKEYTDEQKKRFLVKPGITGYAQVMVRNSASWDERIKLDLVYVNKMGLFFDLYILFLTIWVVIKRENIYPESHSFKISQKS